MREELTSLKSELWNEKTGFRLKLRDGIFDEEQFEVIKGLIETIMKKGLLTKDFTYQEAEDFVREVADLAGHLTEQSMINQSEQVCQELIDAYNDLIDLV